MEYKIRQTYQSNFGKWYSQLDTDNGVMELAFDHEPKSEEIDAVMVDMVVTEPQPESESVITLSDALAVIETKYEEIKAMDVKTLTVDELKVISYIKPAVVAEPVEPIIKVVR
jgi:hypothetical protein